MDVWSCLQGFPLLRQAASPLWWLRHKDVVDSRNAARPVASTAEICCKAPGGKYAHQTVLWISKNRNIKKVRKSGKSKSILSDFSLFVFWLFAGCLSTWTCTAKSTKREPLRCRKVERQKGMRKAENRKVKKIWLFTSWFFVGAFQPRTCAAFSASLGSFGFPGQGYPHSWVVHSWKIPTAKRMITGALPWRGVETSISLDLICGLNWFILFSLLCVHTEGFLPQGVFVSSHSTPGVDLKL